MNITTKATLLSALVFPGAGQIILKRYYRAALLVSVSLVALYTIISSAVNKALAISEKILAGEVAPDVSNITRMIAESPAGHDAATISTTTTILAIAWLLAIIDARFIGKPTLINSPASDSRPS